MSDMLTISKITVPVSGGTTVTYEIKDEKARQAATGAIQLKGTAITPMTDGSTTTPIVVGKLTIAEPEDWAENYTQYYTYSKFTHVFTPVTGETAPEWAANTYYAGDSLGAQDNYAVFYRAKEYVWDGNMWCEFGDMTGLGNMAQADTASTTSYTPYGSIVAATGSTTITGDASGTVDVSSIAVTVSGNAGTHDYAITAVTGESIPSGTSANYTPAGNITNGSISDTEVAFYGVDSTGTLPTLDTSYNENTETLTLSFDRGALMTKTAQLSAAGHSTVTMGTSTFSGTGAYIDVKNVATPPSQMTGTTDASQSKSLTNGGCSIATSTLAGGLEFQGRSGDKITVEPDLGT